MKYRCVVISNSIFDADNVGSRRRAGHSDVTLSTAFELLNQGACNMTTEERLEKLESEVSTLKSRMKQLAIAVIILGVASILVSVFDVF